MEISFFGQQSDEIQFCSHADNFIDASFEDNTFIIFYCREGIWRVYLSTVYQEIRYEGKFNIFFREFTRNEAIVLFIEENINQSTNFRLCVNLKGNIEFPNPIWYEQNNPEGEQNNPEGEQNNPEGEQNNPEGEQNNPEGEQNSRKNRDVLLRSDKKELCFKQKKKKKVLKKVEKWMKILEFCSYKVNESFMDIHNLCKSVVSVIPTNIIEINKWEHSFHV